METDSDWDSDSDGSDFYGPTGKELEEFLNNTEDTSSIRSTIVWPSAITCKDDEDILNINNVLLLNKQTEAKYTLLEEVLYKSLLEIRKKIQENSQAIISHTNTLSNNDFTYIRCGKPYFKDKFNFTPPDNSDTILMKQAQMYDFSMASSVPGWTIKDKTLFVHVLQEMSRNILKEELNTQIHKLLKEDNKEFEIAKLRKKIKCLDKKTLKDIALPLDKEYDWETVANRLNRRHTAQEYQSLWKLFFHPSINKSSWTKAEHRELQVIAKTHNMRDWDSIAKELNTGRTGYQCFIYFRTNMIDTICAGKWTPEETEYLLRVVEYFKEGTFIHWGKVATAMENRTKIQVYNKYVRLMEQRKGRFLEEEDIVILNCYDQFGPDFKKMTEFLPGRSVVQIRTRFQLLTKFRVSTTWTVDDDRKLLQIMANQDSNCSFSDATKHFPGKDRCHIRSRYLTLMKWMKAHPTTDIAYAPRRGARRLIHGHADISLNEALTSLNKRMETEVEKKKKTKLTIQSHEKDIEAGITAALINEIRKEECNKYYEPDEEIILGEENINQKAVTNIQNLRKILIFLKAALDFKLYENSSHSVNFGSLSDTTSNLCNQKVKSYSKTQKVTTVQVGDRPDIWGGKTIEEIKYVLPPNFSTITGCRVLINNISMRSEIYADDKNDVNLSLMARKNQYFRSALHKLKERFQALFLWPLMLSNELPPSDESATADIPDNIPKNRNVVVSHKLTKTDYTRAPIKRPLPVPSGVIIPLPKKSKSSPDLAQNKSIDLKPNSSTSGITLDVNYASLTGSSDIDMS